MYASHAIITRHADGRRISYTLHILPAEYAGDAPALQLQTTEEFAAALSRLGLQDPAALELLGDLQRDGIAARVLDTPLTSEDEAYFGWPPNSLTQAATAAA